MTTYRAVGHGDDGILAAEAELGDGEGAQRRVEDLDARVAQELAELGQAHAGVKQGFLAIAKTVIFTFFVVATFTTPSQASVIVQFESNADRAGGQELFYFTYPTLAALLGNQPSSGSASQIDVNASFSTTGLAFDGSQFIVQFESDADRVGGQELFYFTYPTLAALLGNQPSSGSASQIDVNASFSTTGLAFEGNKGGNGIDVPEPSTLTLFVLPLIYFMGLVWRRTALEGAQRA